MSLEPLLRDVRFGLRILRRSPGFTITAVLTLALGIGANTAIFTAANDFLLRPLPFANSDRVVMVKLYDRKLLDSGWTDPANFKFWREHNSVFQEIAAWSEAQSEYNLTGPEGPERVNAKQVTVAFFRVLGVQPTLGRTFIDGEDRPNASRLALISHSLWQTRYGGTSAVLGKTLLLNGKDFTIIGVLPAGFRFSTTPDDVWTLLPDSGDASHGGYFLNAIALLKPGAAVGQAQADMSVVWAEFAREFPDWSQDMSVAVEPMRDRYIKELRPALVVLLFAAALVLLIACVNLANLLLARASTRQKEVAIRQAVGGARTRILRQLLTENALLALLGGIAGLFLAFAGVGVLYTALPTEWQPLTRGGINATVLVFALAVSLFTVLLFGVAPAWGMTSLDVDESLKDSRSPLTGVTRKLLRTVLVTGEIALAVMLVTGAGLLIRSFVQLSAVPMGFRAENVLTATISRTKNDAYTFFDTVLSRVSALPEVRAAGAVNILPLSGSDWSQDIVIEGQPRRPKGDSIWAAHREVNLGYFRAVGIPLLAGRSFTATDFNKPIAVISETMARRYWPGEDPIGRRFGVNCDAPPKCEWNSVVGVVGDVKEVSAKAEPAIAMYFLDWSNTMTLLVRGTQQPARFATDIRGIIHSVDPDQPISEVHTMENIVSESVAPQRLTMFIAGLFAALALALASIGIYGLVSYSVSERSHEFGVRITLGAEQADILKLIEGQGLKLALVGITAGVVGALTLMRLASSLLFGVKPTDPLTFLLAALTLGIVTLVATYLPARRAMRVDPIVELRHQ